MFMKKITHLKEAFLEFLMVCKFCTKNKKYWNSYKSKGTYIYIAHTFPSMFEMLFSEMLFCKGMECISKYNFIALSSRREISFKKICKSFYIEPFFINRFSIKLYAKVFKETLKMRSQITNGRDLLRYKYRKILIGPSVYDSILLNIGRCTYEGERNFKTFRAFFKSILLVEQLTNIFSQKPPSLCIVMEEAYEAEIYRRVAKAYGARIIWISQMLKEYVDQNGNVTTFYDNILKREIGEKLEKVQQEGIYTSEVERQLNNYYQKGDIGDIKGRVLSGAAVKDKVTKTKEEMIKEINLDPNKKNIFIFSHCMTDGPHACYNLLYQDYFVWLKRTLEIARRVKSVNWIVKLHPDRFKRVGQEKIDTQKIIDECEKSNNIYIYPDEYSLLSVKMLADAVVTARGKVGEEMSCYGIPVITAGSPCYSVWGYTHTFDTAEEYEKCLFDIDKIERLDASKIDLAKKIFYAHSLSTYEIMNDDIGKEIKKATQERKEGTISYRIINIKFLKKMLSGKIFAKMRKSHIYMAGKKYAERTETAV